MRHRTPIEVVAALVHAIEQHHGRAMLIGGAALFLYSKPQRSMDYDLWVRMANDKLVEILTAHGFEIDANRAGRMVAYYEEYKFDFLLFKRAYNRDKELIEYDAIEANGRVVPLKHGKLLIPSVEDMIPFLSCGSSGESHAFNFIKIYAASGLP